MNIIGISAGYHDSACCLLQDGRLVAAAQEERFSRIKNDHSFPIQALRYCLREASLTMADVDCIAFYEDPELKLGRQMWMAMLPGVSRSRRASILRRALKHTPEEELLDRLGYSGRIEIVDHHLSHAASSYYFSGFGEAAILTVDGVGDLPTTTYGSGAGATITRFDQVDFPHSLGFFYSALTSYLGFEVNEGEYKVMGLAPYGKPTYTHLLRQLVNVGIDGQYTLNLSYFGFLHENKMYSEELPKLLGSRQRNPNDEITQFHKDIAKSAQIVLEDILLQKLTYLHSKVPSDNLCMAGGVALNVVANSRCIKEGPFKSLFVQAAAGDAGSCLGAAAVAHVRMVGNRPLHERQQHVYLGPRNQSNEIRHMLCVSGIDFLDFHGKEKELIERTADELSQGAVVGWARGRMEFGPRALGARSIIADPRRVEMRDKINSLVKKRETFRPFAPAVLESLAKEHFDLDHPSPFMLETCQVRSEIDLPAITHVDGSARVQTVNSETNPGFAELLLEFYNQTGCPILLNTSFNVRGEPIVCTAIDALLSFVRAGLDVLVLEEFILYKSAIPTSWQYFAHVTHGRQKKREEQSEYLVYTLI